MPRFSLTLFLLLCALPTLAAPRYRITPLPGMEVEDNGASINSKGQIVSGDVLWYNGKRRKLSTPLPSSEYPTVTARGINDAGTVVGDASGSSDGAWLANYGDAVVWHTAKGKTLPVRGQMSTSAVGINNAGVIVGTAYQEMPVQDQSIYRAFLFQHGRTIFLDASGAVAINNRGQVLVQVDHFTEVGYNLPHFFLLSHGKRVRIQNILTHADFNEASAMNDAGVVVGSAYLWRQGHVTELGSLSKGIATPAAINNREQVVGKAEVGPPIPPSVMGVQPLHAFLWQKGRMNDLNTLIPARSGWVLTEADAINDRGQIVCAGNKGACLLTPISNLKRRP